MYPFKRMEKRATPTQDAAEWPDLTIFVLPVWTFAFHDPGDGHFELAKSGYNLSIHCTLSCECDR